MAKKLLLFWMFSLLGIYGLGAAEDEIFIQRYEKFIPFDYYPGLERKDVIIGNIVALDKEAKTMTVRADSETYHYKVMENTPIWLDRPQLKARNLKGSFSDLETGLRAEIQTAAGADKTVAQWIKVQLE